MQLSEVNMPDIYAVYNETHKAFICESFFKDHLMMNIWFGWDDVPY